MVFLVLLFKNESESSKNSQNWQIWIFQEVGQNLTSTETINSCFKKIVNVDLEKNNFWLHRWKLHFFFRKLVYFFKWNWSTLGPQNNFTFSKKLPSQKMIFLLSYLDWSTLFKDNIILFYYLEKEKEDFEKEEKIDKSRQSKPKEKSKNKIEIEEKEKFDEEEDVCEEPSSNDQEENENDATKDKDEL